MTIIDQMKSPVQPDASSFILNLSSFFKFFKDTLHTMLHYMPSFQLIVFQESLYWGKYTVLLLSNEFIFHMFYRFWKQMMHFLDMLVVGK